MDENTDQEQRLSRTLDAVRVNAPAIMLRDGLLDMVLERRIHPEIGLDARVLDRMPRGDIETMAARIRDAGLRPTAHGPFLDLSPGAMDPAVLDLTRNRFHRALELAAVCGAEHIVLHHGWEEWRHGFNREEWRENSLATWRETARRARDLGVRVVLENVFEARPQDLEPMLSALAGDGVGFCFDIGHANVFGRADILEWLEVLTPHLQALHLHDNHGDQDEHLPIGYGAIDFRSFFKWLADHRVRPRTVTLEPHEEWQLTPSVEALSKLWPWELP